MEANDLSQALQVIMSRYGWTQLQTAENLGLRQPYLSKIINRKNDLKITDAQEAFRRIGWQLTLTLREEPDEVKRREFMASAAAVAFIPSPQASPYQDPEYLKSLASRLHNLTSMQGGIPVAAEAVRHASQVQSAIRNVTSPHTNKAASELIWRTSLVISDIPGKQAKSEVLGKLALNLAARSRDTLSQGECLQTLSAIARRNGEQDKAIVYAKSGLSLADLTSELKARLTCRMGQALALNPHMKAQARHYIDKALTIDGLDTAGRAAIIGNSGTALADLNENVAHGMLTQAATMCEDFSPLMQAGYLAANTISLLNRREFDEAAEWMGKLATLLPMLNSGGLDKDVRNILALCTKESGLSDAKDQLAFAVGRTI
ncbi:helix-turn-helix domain-containing protein [Rhizohabitans arisaemae]|uniref:helix-turn-helix domain-containing protein n=1 Tax=Rhizohabitans arisaemae TaxID=2720610 RepID=UPI0024B231E6|nr:hypothetical protein [Rhizohabitans arisaemae]